MEITPPRTPSLGPLTPSTGTSSPRGAQKASGSPEEKVMAKERETQKRISESQSQVESAQRDASYQLDRIREGYDEKSAKQQAELDDALETQRNKGYERLRNLKREQQNEMHRTRREGDMELHRAKQHYVESSQSTRQRANHEIEEERRETSERVQNERGNHAAAIREMELQHQNQFARTKESHDQRVAHLGDEMNREYERLRGQSAESTERAQTHFQERYRTAVETQSRSIENLNNKASRQIQEIRSDTAHKLAAYNSRQKDPFYKMVELGVRVHDDGDQYVMTANVPEHEQKNISVSLKGNNLVISGHRRNEERLEVAQGHSKGTATFQSFSESFPLPWPVDGKELTRFFEGDRLYVAVPKKKMTYEAKVVQPPSKARVEKPKFPDNLPNADNAVPKDASVGDASEAAQASTKTRGSRTLG